MTRHVVAAALFLLYPLSTPPRAAAPLPQVVARADSAAPYRFDLARYYFSLPEAEVAGRAHLRERGAALRAAGERLTTSPAALLRALGLADSFRMESKRHTIYLYLRTQLNTLDEASAQAQSTLEADLDAVTSVIRNGLLKLDDAKLASWTRTVPALETYRFAIESVRRNRKFTLPAEQEGIVSRLAPIAEDWPQALYHRLIARTDFGTIVTPAGELSVLRDRGAISVLADTALRAEGVRRLWAGYGQHRDLYAVALAGAVRSKSGLARVRGYRDAPDEAYQRAYLSTEEVRVLLGRMRPAAQVYKSFQRMSAEIARQPRPVPPPGGGTPLHFTVTQAAEVIGSALAPLANAEYAKEFAALVDPASGRLDVTGGPNRAGGGGSTGYPGIPSAIYLENFDGSYPALSRLAHEAGHAVEDQLVHLHGVPAVYARGAPYLSEAYALFTELVVANALYEKAPNPRVKRYYLAQFLSKAMEVFHGAQDADLEQSIYNAMDGGGSTIGADDLDSLTSRVDTAYSIYGETAPEVRARWITARLLYEDPLYLFNYMYSGLLSLKLFDSYQRDPPAFGARYVALLSSGYRAAPTVAVRQAFGIDLQDPHLLDDATAFLRARLETYGAPLPESAAASASAQRPGVDTIPALAPAARGRILDALFRQLARRYVFPDSVPRVEAQVRARARAGAYDSARTAAAFGDAVTHDLRQFDRHFDLRLDRVRYDALRAAGADSLAVLPELPPSPDAMRSMRASNYGVRRAELLSGNVGVISLRHLHDLRYSRAALTAALTFVSNTEAVLLDLREVPGGSGSAVAFVVSAFFGADSVETLTMYDRELGTTTRGWTHPGMGAPRLREQKLYIVVDGGTGSAAEALAFTLQQLGRGRVVGTRTAGAAHVGGWTPVADGFVVFLPNARGFIPSTGRDWEGTGVQPDLAASSGSALAAAHAEAVDRLLARASDSTQRSDLAWLSPLLRARVSPPARVDTLLGARLAGRYERVEIRFVGGELLFVGASGTPQPLSPLPDGTFVIEDSRFEPEDQVRLALELDEAGTPTRLFLLVRDGRRLSRARLP